MTFTYLPFKRFAMLFAIICTAVVSGGTKVQAYTNPFSVGYVDSLDCNTGSPVLVLSIRNNGSVPSSQNTAQWSDPKIYVAYRAGDGSLLETNQKIPNIAAGNETALSIAVQRADTSFIIAIHATDPAGNTVKLLTGTSITPADHCPPPPTLLKPIVSENPIVQQATSTINAAMLARYLKDTPTNVNFAKGQACFKLTANMSCVTNTGFGLLVDWEYDYRPATGAADGFRVYRVDRGQRIYMTSVSGNLNVYAAILPAPKTGDFSGQCFAVVAVRNSVETDLSPSKCATSHDSLHQARLKTDVARSWGVETEDGGGVTKSEYGETRVDTVAVPYIRNTPTSLSTGAGYAHDTNSHTFGADENANLVVRMGAHFNMTPYAGAGIVKATFSLLAANALVNYNATTGSCPMLVAPATSDGWLTSPNDIFVDLDPGKAGTFQAMQGAGAVQKLDVTSLVQSWEGNANTNHGLIVRGTDENLGAKLNGSSCLSLLGGSLEIQYY